jgi:hypothetical protein
MARRKSGLGKVLVIGGVGLLGYYGYKKGWFDPVKKWWAGLSDGEEADTTPSNTTPSDTTPSDSDSGSSWFQNLIDGIVDHFGGNNEEGGSEGGNSLLSDIFDKVDDWFDKKRDEKTQETIVEQGAGVLSTIIPALTAPAGAAAGATVAAGAAAPSQVVGAATTSPAAVQGSTSTGAAQAASTFASLGTTPAQLVQLAQAPLGTQIAAAAMAAVPVFIGTSSAVAEGVHKANVSITKVLQDLGIQKQTAAIQGEPSKQEKIAGFAITRMETKYGAANVAAAGITKSSALAMMESTDDTNTLTSKLRAAYLAKK